jgi:tetratricopeptide (TPR) repeat protein
MTEREGRQRVTHPHWGRRRRRLRRVVLLLVVGAVVTLVAGTLLYRAGRPDVRRPGEELDDVTRRLDRHVPESAPNPRFTDVTVAAGLGTFRTFHGERTSQLPEDMGSGLAWGDFDGDGDDDLFVVAAGGPVELPPEERAPSLLFENLGDGAFGRVESFPDVRILGMGAAWGDADGDGRLDLVVSGYRALRLFRNTESGFVRDTGLPEPAGYWAGATWGDFDNDRDLDLYVTGYVEYREESSDRERTSDQYGAAVPYTLNPISYPPAPNLLFENLGDGSFREVAQERGVANPEGRSLSALWHDFDADGWLDLYVANDVSDNAFYLNRQGRFEDAGHSAWVADYRGAMGLAAGDWNRDGDDDLFVTHWVAQENALFDSLLVDIGAEMQRLAFSDVAAPHGLGQIALRFVGWGTEFGDFDADGWLDLMVANGSTFERAENRRLLEPQADFLLWSEEGRYFHDLAPLCDALETPRTSRGLAVADYDGDGDLDVAIIDLDGGVRLLRNDLEQGHRLQLRLRSRGPSGEATGLGEGATVVAKVGELELRRSVSSASYLSQSSSVLHFGLGGADRVDRLEVHWLGGERQVFGGLEADAVYELVEGEGEPRPLGSRASSPSEASAAALPDDPRARTLLFWQTQRAAMDALKRDGDCAAAMPLFRRALALDASHQDSRYYLSNCLAVEGRTDEALAELAVLRREHPESHRAHKHWGVLRAVYARGEEDLLAAAAALERALEINLEETGSLLALGEVELLLGELDLAEERLELACRTNPRAVGGFFLRAYIAWRRGDERAARELLEKASAARGEDFKPEGGAAEGETARLMHREVTPLSRYWERWDGTTDPAAALGSLLEHLEDSVGGG